MEANFLELCSFVFSVFVCLYSVLLCLNLINGKEDHLGWEDDLTTQAHCVERVLPVSAMLSFFVS